MKLISHLSIDQCKLAPASEWSNAERAWKIVLVREGILYWLGRDPVEELGPGDVIVLDPSARCVLRASRLGPAALNYFHFHPEHLAGLISITERLSIQNFASIGGARHFVAADPIAREFADIVSDPRRRSFLHRCRMLHLMAMIFGDAAPAAAPSRCVPLTSLLRYEEVVSRISDSELMHCPSKKLAQMCGCSVRHFRRVFRKHFKTSVRAKQTELRLNKACQLLAETDERIVNIAIESGYRHLGFFNAAFKKRFGVTPSEWRRRQVSSAEHVNGLVPASS